MSQRWAEDPDGWRFWPLAPGARWKPGPDGVTTGGTAAGRGIPTANEKKTAERSNASHRAGLIAAGADAHEQDMLIAIASRESSGRGDLPIVGDGGTALGPFQMRRAAVSDVGIKWETLRHSKAANYRAALAHLRRYRGRHEGDMPTAGAQWNAGDVRPNARSEWRVVETPGTITAYVRAYNAL